jgi:hypothetical protein
VLHLPKGDIRAIPDRAQKRVIQVFIEGRRYDQRRKHAAALGTSRVRKVRDQSCDYSFFLGCDLELVAGRTKKPV